MQLLTKADTVGVKPTFLLELAFAYLWPTSTISRGFYVRQRYPFEVGFFDETIPSAQGQVSLDNLYAAEIMCPVAN